MSDEDHIVCQSYTTARRFPKVIGAIAGQPLYTTLSYAQLVTMLAVALVLLWTRPLWGVVVPGGMLRLAVLIGLPVWLGWLVRHGRYEGRSPRHALVGVVSLWWRVMGEPGGHVNGRHWRDPRSERLASRRIFTHR